MRVGLLMDKFAVGGTERQMEILVRSLRGQVEFTLLALWSEPTVAARFESLAPTRVLNPARSQYPLLPGRIARWSRHERCDVVLAAHRFVGFLAKLARLIGMATPVVCSLRGRSHFNLKQRILYDLIDPLLSVQASAVVVNSEAIRQSLPDWRWFQRRIRHIPNGLLDIDCDRAAAHSELRREYSWPSGSVVMISVGRLTEVKRPALAVHAFNALRERHPEARLLWVGDGPLRDEFDRLTAGLGGSASCAGQVEDPARLLAGADVYFHPSQWESTSNAVLEAMQLALPVVARRVPGNASLIDHGGSGFLFDSDAEAVELVAQLIRDSSLRDRVGSEARASVRERFSVHAMAQMHLEVLRAAAGIP